MTEFELIDAVRMKTSMYIGKLSPTHLNAFLSGYNCAIEERNINKQESELRDFHNWVAKKLNYAESTSGWANMIENQREDKKEALYLFFELLDEYRGIKHEEIAETENINKDKLDRSWRGYSRLKKVRGTFKEVSKPLPSKLIIRKMNIIGNWFQLIAKNDEEEILFVSNSEELAKIYKRAYEVFGINKDDWNIKIKNGS